MTIIRKENKISNSAVKKGNDHDSMLQWKQDEQLAIEKIQSFYSAAKIVVSKVRNAEGDCYIAVK